MTFSDTFVEVDGCKTHLRRAGKGEPLLFLHGASGAPAIMPFMEKLAQRFDVLVPEHPGWGMSDEPEWLENIHDVAYFYLDFLKQLDSEECHRGRQLDGRLDRDGDGGARHRAHEVAGAGEPGRHRRAGRAAGRYFPDGTGRTHQEPVCR